MAIFNKIKELSSELPDPILAVMKIFGIIILSILIIKIGCYIIKKVFEKHKALKPDKDGKKGETMETLLLSVFKYGIYIMAGIIILSDVLDLKSILAAAGIGGIALGLGAQSLIKDVLSGFFIVMEDQYVVGDMITVDTMTGTVEKLEFRVTRLRNFNGDLYIIPNGEIKRVTNHTRGNKAVIVDVPLAYSADIEKAIKVAEGICAKVAEEYEAIVDGPQVLGITDLGKESLNLRIMATALPTKQWEVERGIRKLIKEEFDKENIAFYDKNRIISE